MGQYQVVSIKFYISVQIVISVAIKVRYYVQNCRIHLNVGGSCVTESTAAAAQALAPNLEWALISQCLTEA